MKIADTPPPFCAACYGQYSDRRHIDFEAAWDGPVFEGEGVHTGDEGVRNKLPVGIDDLVICEECLKAAAKQLGWAGPKAQQRIDQLEQALDRAQSDLRDETAEKDALAEIVAKREDREPARPPEEVSA